jgi:hypothetical protein
MRELRIYKGLPGKGKETRTLGRDRRRPSGHDPPPGWVGGLRISCRVACCLHAVSRIIGGSPPAVAVVVEAQMPRSIL